MDTKDLIDSPFIATAATILAASAGAAESNSVEELIAHIKSPDDAVRGPAWQNAGKFGAPAVKPLGSVWNDPDPEIARAAKRALWKIVRYTGRPGAVVCRRRLPLRFVPASRDPDLP